jgi:hypothetical protein
MYPKMERHCQFIFGLGITLVPVPLTAQNTEKHVIVVDMGHGMWRLGEPAEIARISGLVSEVGARLSSHISEARCGAPRLLRGEAVCG